MGRIFANKRLIAGLIIGFAGLAFFIYVSPACHPPVEPRPVLGTIIRYSNADAAIPPIKEFRSAGRIAHETKGKFFNYSNRYSIECRLQDLKNIGEYLLNWRVRYMIRFYKSTLRLLSNTKPVTFTIDNEVFLQFRDAEKNNPNVFDQKGFTQGHHKKW